VGYAAALLVSGLLLGLGLWTVRRRTLASRIWAGAVLSTLVVDALFWGTAMVLAGAAG